MPTIEFTDHTADVMSITINPENKKVFVSGSCDTTAKIWDTRNRNPQMTFSSETLDGHAHESDVNSVDFLPNGYTFASGSDDSTCQMFDIRACAQLNKFHSTKILQGITSVAASKSGRLLFAGYDDNKCLAWDTLSKNVIWGQFIKHENRVSCVGLNATGQALATGSWDTTIKIWA